MMVSWIELVERRFFQESYPPPTSGPVAEAPVLARLATPQSPAESKRVQWSGFFKLKFTALSRFDVRLPASIMLLSLLYKSSLPSLHSPVTLCFICAF
ncbi:hypothetical protein E2C01_052072 [Portunus trituberculatus]|uniref:Uncharacterized protein n=1 Tax=Portunus trituberculatus TaxID=210409 RepID=A0A5B7GLD5_PORTR|nr:hypothetical protein [Portunus trituberculatus]